MTTSVTASRASFLSYSHTIGLLVMSGRGFQYPIDAAEGKDGKLYVANRTSGYGEGVQVTMCDTGSGYFGAFGSNGRGDGQFTLMSAIATDSDGLVYVSDDYLCRVSVFDPDGRFLETWGEPGPAEGQMDGPSGLAFDRDDNLYVVDQRNNRVQKFAKGGSFLGAFGSGGSGDGEFNLPWGVCVSPGGDVYVADWRNDRIQRFISDGEHVASYVGEGAGRLNRPAGLAVDEEGYMYVADWGNDRFVVLDSGGAYVTSSRGEATLSPWAEEFLDVNVEEAEARALADLAPDLDYGGDTNEESSYVEKYFWGPVAVMLDSAGRVYVVDCNRHRLQVFDWKIVEEERP